MTTLFVLGLLCLSLGNVTPMTVKTLDLESYQGRWYQIYGNNFAKS